MRTIKFIIFITVITIIFSVNASAQVSLPLLVAPVKQELTLNLGEKTAINVRFFNQGDVPVSGILRVADFLVLDKSGAPTLIDNPNQASPRFSASQWITLPYDRMTIAANDKVAVQAKIEVPQDARAGGRYVAVYFQPGGIVPSASFTPREAGTGVASRIASLVYIKIPGDIAEQAVVSNFFAKSFWEYGPIEVETEIVNRGDYHIRPRAVLTITNFLGGIVSQDKLIEQNIFPDAALTYKNSIGPKWMIGKYRIDLAASYGDKGQALTRSLSVWVFPWRLALIIVLLLIILYLIVRSLLNRFKTHEVVLEHELKDEKEEIEKLKEELKKRQE